MVSPSKLVRKPQSIFDRSPMYGKVICMVKTRELRSAKRENAKLTEENISLKVRIALLEEEKKELGVANELLVLSLHDAHDYKESMRASMLDDMRDMKKDLEE